MDKELEEIKDLSCAIDSSLQVSLHPDIGDQEYKERKVEHAMRLSHKIYKLVTKLINENTNQNRDTLPTED